MHGEIIKIIVNIQLEIVLNLILKVYLVGNELFPYILTLKFIFCGIFPASKQAYRPPSARGRESNFKLHDDDDSASNARPGGDCEFIRYFHIVIKTVRAGEIITS